MNTRNGGQGIPPVTAGPTPAGDRSVRNGAAEDVEWIVTTRTAPWQARGGLAPQTRAGPADVMVRTENPRQTIEGFGACFNELGWTSLAALDAEECDGILCELFAPGGIVVVMQNDLCEELPVRVRIGDRVIAPTLPADSFNSFVVEP